MFPQYAEAVRAALASRISESREPLDAQHIGKALYGMKECGHSAAAEAARAALASNTSESQAPADAQHIGNALYGLKECGRR